MPPSPPPSSTSNTGGTPAKGSSTGTPLREASPSPAVNNPPSGRGTTISVVQQRRRAIIDENDDADVEEGTTWDGGAMRRGGRDGYQTDGDTVRG